MEVFPEYKGRPFYITGMQFMHTEDKKIYFQENHTLAFTSRPPPVCLSTRLRYCFEWFFLQLDSYFRLVNSRTSTSRESPLVMDSYPLWSRFRRRWLNKDHINILGQRRITNAVLPRRIRQSVSIYLANITEIEGFSEHDALMECCPKSDHPGNPEYFEFCDFTPYITINKLAKFRVLLLSKFVWLRVGNVVSKHLTDKCGQLVAKYGQALVFG